MRSAGFEICAGPLAARAPQRGRSVLEVTRSIVAGAVAVIVAVIVVVVALAQAGCVLGVGIGGKRCDAKHGCVPGYVCASDVCVSLADVVVDGGGFAPRDAGQPSDAGSVDTDAGGGPVDAGEGAPDAGNPDGGTCIVAADGIERCNDFDDDCNGTLDDGCADNGCVDDDTFAGALISVCTNALDWQSARAVCQQRGMDLVVLQDAAFSDAVQADLVALNGGNDAWVGGSDLATEGTFLWVDGSDFRFEDFDNGQPNDLNGAQDCVASDQVRWNDEDCTLTQAFVCARPPPPVQYTFCSGTPVDNDGDGVDCRTDCNDDDSSIHPGHVEICGDRVDNDCDGIVDEACAACQPLNVGGALLCERETTWTEARDKCHDLGMHLGKIEDQALEDAVQAVFTSDSPGNIWIGLNDRASPGTDVWDDGSPLGTFNVFGDGQPSDPQTQNCFDLRDTDPAGVDGGPAGDGIVEWHDIFCDDVDGAYLCTP